MLFLTLCDIARFCTMAWFVATILAVITSLLLLGKFAHVSHDAKEPPLIPQTFPYVGHLFGMLQHGSRYYTQIRSVHVSDEQ